MATSDYAEQRTLDYWLRANSLTSTAPATVYVALLTADPTDTGAFTNEVSNTGTAYARISVAFDVVGATSGATANTSELAWTQATGTWGTVSHIAICDSGTYQTGNVLFYGALTTGKLVDTNDTFKIAAGDLDITLT